MRGEGKWLELLKEIAARVTRAEVFGNRLASGEWQSPPQQSVSAPLGVELSPVDGRDAIEIERGA